MIDNSIRHKEIDRSESILTFDNTVLVFLLLMFITVFAGCSRSPHQPFDIQSIKTFQEIPGITSEETAAIESLKNSRSKFSFGQMLITEAFILPDGTYAGFTVEFCRLLSDLFGIEFALDLYDWASLKQGVDGMIIDFTGEFITIPERTGQYYMTFPIAERTHRLFMMQENYNKIQTEQDVNGLRIGHLEDSVEPDHVKYYYPELNINFIGMSSLDAVTKLVSGEIDAFLGKAVLDPTFDQYDLIRSRDFFQLVYTPVSLSTANPELAPVINVVNKYLAAGGIDILHDLYRQGNEEYARYKLGKSFTEEEKTYLNSLAQEGKTVKAALQIGNYPICFYNHRETQFEGIVMDVLAEISKLTGIVFEPANDGDTEWPQLLEMLNTGEASLVSQLIYSADREGQFLWSDRPNASSYYALISKNDHPNLANYQVVRNKVGTVRNSAFESVYREWFVNNDNLTLYNNQIDALNALETGEIDLLMGSDFLLLMQQNFYEKPGYKINIRFHSPVGSYFGFNLNETLLCSIVNKALDYVPLDTIANDWTSRGYDYTARMTQQRMTYSMIIASVMFVLVILAVFFIIKLHKHDRELKVQKEAAQAASRSKSAFLANMSHEMRTPLTSVIGLTELTLRTARLDNETHGNLIKVYRSGETLLGLINDILDISKIEADRFTLNPTEYDLPSLLNDAVTQSLLYLGEKPVELILDITEDLPRRLFGDELRVKQIFNNLLSNAFKFTKEGTVTLTVRCENDTVCSTADSVWLTVRVTDTGIGIKPQDFEKLFTLYANMEEENKVHDRTRRIEGTGLGLSICKRIAEMMDGSITVESEHGKGSVFTARIRQKYIDNSVIGADVVESLKKFHYSIDKFLGTEKSRINLSYARVLVVDDNTANLDVAKGLMSLYGMRVDCVTGGRQAIDVMRDQTVKYNAIFMDHMMPDIDGIEAVRLIREIGTEYAKNIPIIALTANAVLGNEEMFLNKGFQGFIAKPIDLTLLDNILRQWVRDKDAEALLQDKWIQIGDKSINERQIITADIPGLDVNKGITHFIKEDVFAGVLRSYAKNTKPLLEIIKETNPANLEEYALIVHGIKGSSRGIFAEAVGNEAEALEHAAKAGDYEYVKANHQKFLDALHQLIDDIENAINKDKGKPVKDKPDKEHLAAFLAACKSYNVDGMDEAMAEIEKWEYTFDEGLSEWLRASLRQGKHKIIQEKLSEILGEK